MIPISLNSLDLPFINQRQVAINHYTLPKANEVRINMTNEISIKKSLLALVNAKDVCSAHLFKFNAENTEWIVFEPECYPLKRYEVRGSMIFGIQSVRRDYLSQLVPTEVSSDRYLFSTKAVCHQLQKIKNEDKIFILLIFKNYAMATGNYFDESLLCHAMLSYRSRRPKHTLSYLKTDWEHLISEEKESVFQPKAVHLNITKNCYKKSGRKNNFRRNKNGKNV